MVFRYSENKESYCVCNECHKKITAGYQCGFRMNDGNIWFNREYCSLKCLNSFASTPHIFGHDYIQHFFNEHIEEAPNSGDLYDEFIEKHKHKFLGPVNVPEEVALKSAGLTMATKILLGRYE